MPDLDTLLRDSLASQANAFSPARRDLPDVSPRHYTGAALAAGAVVVAGGIVVGGIAAHRSGGTHEVVPGSPPPTSTPSASPTSSPSAVAASSGPPASYTLGHGDVPLGRIIDTGRQAVVPMEPPASGERVYYIYTDSQCPSKPDLGFGVGTSDGKVIEVGGYTCAVIAGKKGVYDTQPGPDNDEYALLGGGGTVSSDRGAVQVYPFDYDDLSLVLAPAGAKLTITGG